ncbi:hypothetical protein [Flavobacterium sp. W22_SRS_FP1]|uniref:hypothetical protein n=1 Tax=Flavobacterium sp. W22_SRS_FP1 TaxID=3240276 RepID=UPI003F902416
MQYINPIEILDLSKATDISSIDNEKIKKNRKRLFADIELSDGEVYDYYGVKLSKGDCERVIDDLANPTNKEFYLYLSNNRQLNEFLINGNDSIFNNFKHDSIFKLPDFITFISPYFTPKFDHTLFIAFKNKNISHLKAILKTDFFISQSDVNTAFRTLTNDLQNKISEINEIRKDIKNEESNYDEDDIHKVLETVKDYFPSELLNCLPQYFNSQILKIAKSINFLSNSIWDAFDTTQVPNDLTKYLLTLNISGLERPVFEKNYKIIKKKNDERIEQEKHGPVLKKYASFIIESKIKIEGVKNKTITPAQLKIWIENNLNFTVLNNLDAVFNEIKSQIAITLKILSVEVYNKYSDVECSIYLINKANNINSIDPSFKEIIKNASNDLQKIKREKEIRLLRNLQLPKNVERSFTSTSPPSSNNNGIIWLFVAMVFIGVMVSLGSEKDTNNYASDEVYPIDTVAVDTASVAVDIPAIRDYDEIYNDTIDTAQEYIPSPYLGNQLMNGASPLDDCFGKGLYNGRATLTIKNGGSSDAIICLYSISDDRTIRNEYVQKDSNFKMSNISQGNYKIRVLYGNDWNPNLTNSCGSTGNFENNVNFSEFDSTDYFEDSDRGHTVATITLYTVEGGNASSSSIDQSTFFKK